MNDRTAADSGELVHLLASANARLQKYVGSALAVHGLSYNEYLVLHHLHDAAKGALRRIDLAECIGLSASGVTRLINPMEKIGLVRKQANARDARVSLVALSDAGARVYRDSRVTFEDAAQRRLASVRPALRTALAELGRALD